MLLAPVENHIVFFFFRPSEAACLFLFFGLVKKNLPCAGFLGGRLMKQMLHLNLLPRLCKRKCCIQLVSTALLVTKEVFRFFLLLLFLLLRKGIVDPEPSKKKN